MSKFSLAPAAAVLIAAGLAVLPSAPAAAQKSKLSEIIVYGTDPCPRSTDDNIVVCARKPESERYRIPEKLREGGTLQQREAWANKAMRIERYGRTGIQACSPVGPGGWTGCTQQLIDQAFRERREENSADTAPRM